MSRVAVSIDVSDLEAGLRFYGRVFGWEERARPFPAMAVLDAGNVSVCMHAKPAGSRPTPGEGSRDYARHWTPVHLDLHVDDYTATMERAVAEGAVVERTFVGGPHPDTAFCSDPFGNGFCVIGPR
ncbi:MAG: VOC family protein [Myxococcales bacterium]|nr:VOC family protein [Myxococcales bacterium]